MSRLPNFICIGAPKSGTTSLHHYLKQHPEVFLPDKKELHFFAAEDLARRQAGPGDRYVVEEVVKTLDDYRRHYSKVANATAVGEMSPSYLYYHDTVVGRIKDLLGDVKIIVLLRNPVEKAYSQYMHLVGEARETMDFKMALAMEKERSDAGYGDFWLYKTSSTYADGLEHYFSEFGPDNVRVYLSDELKKETRSILADICSYIGVDPAYDFDVKHGFNRSGLPKSRLVANLFMKPNILTAAARKIIPSRLGAPVRRFIQERNVGVTPALDPEVYSELRSWFEPDIRRVEILLGRQTGW